MLLAYKSLTLIFMKKFIRVCLMPQYKMAESLDGSARSGSKEFLLRKTQEQSLGIARTLWREGLVHLSPFSTRDEPIVSDMFSCYESCLSPAVRALLGRPLPPVSGEEGDTFINFGLTLNWDKVETPFAKGKDHIINATCKIT